MIDFSLDVHSLAFPSRLHQVRATALVDKLLSSLSYPSRAEFGTKLNLKSRHGRNKYLCVDEEVAFVLMSETLFIFEKHAGGRCALFRHVGDYTLAETVQTSFQTRLRVMGIFKKTKASVLSASQCLLHIDTSPQCPVNNVDHVLAGSQATSKKQHIYCLKSQSSCKRGNAAMQSSEAWDEWSSKQPSQANTLAQRKAKTRDKEWLHKNEQKNTARKSIVASRCFIFLSLLFALYPWEGEAWCSHRILVHVMTAKSPLTSWGRLPKTHRHHQAAPFESAGVRVDTSADSVL